MSAPFFTLSSTHLTVLEVHTEVQRHFKKSLAVTVSALLASIISFLCTFYQFVPSLSLMGLFGLVQFYNLSDKYIFYFNISFYTYLLTGEIQDTLALGKNLILDFYLNLTCTSRFFEASNICVLEL